MKIDVDQKISDLDNKNIDGITVKSVLISVLTRLDRDESPSGEDKFKWYQIADKISKGGEVKLKSEEVVIIKERLGKLAQPLVLGRIYDLLDSSE